MKSNFKIVSYFLPLFFLFMTGLFAKVMINMDTTFTSVKAGSIVMVFMFLGMMVVFFELRDKIIKVEITVNGILIKRYVGIGSIITINKRSIDGFHSSVVSTKYGSYDYLYLMSGNNKVAKISNQYHKNFNQLSFEIKKQYKDLGFVSSGLISEFKDFFKTN